MSPSDLPNDGDLDWRSIHMVIANKGLWAWPEGRVKINTFSMPLGGKSAAGQEQEPEIAERLAPGNDSDHQEFV